MMNATPEKEHEWLMQLVGEWAWEFEARMKPDDPPMKFSGTEKVRAIGQLWIQGESTGQTPDGTPTVSLLTLGYDPKKKSFVGTWLGSMMTYLWSYEGTLAPDGKSLPLRTVGPHMMEEGKTATYEETVTLDDKDHRKFASAMINEDGTRVKMMEMVYRRVS